VFRIAVAKPPVAFAPVQASPLTSSLMIGGRRRRALRERPVDIAQPEDLDEIEISEDDHSTKGYRLNKWEGQAATGFLRCS
jgi:hypothetical protein